MINWNSLEQADRWSPSYRFVDASELGLRPGDFPKTLMFRDANNYITFQKVEVTRDHNGDVIMYTYECPSLNLFLDVFND